MDRAAALTELECARQLRLLGDIEGWLRVMRKFFRSLCYHERFVYGLVTIELTNCPETAPGVTELIDSVGSRAELEFRDGKCKSNATSILRILARLTPYRLGISVADVVRSDEFHARLLLPQITTIDSTTADVVKDLITALEERLDRIIDGLDRLPSGLRRTAVRSELAFMSDLKRWSINSEFNSDLRRELEKMETKIANL